ncbi:MAG TPA: hypothetical protein VF082_07940, partial [Jiangellaceae bacterium]
MRRAGQAWGAGRGERRVVGRQRGDRVDRGEPGRVTADQAADMLWPLAGFDAFDRLYTGRSRTAEEVVPHPGQHGRAQRSAGDADGSARSGRLVDQLGQVELLPQPVHQLQVGL